ncbi:D-alanyl-D-alanine carboxypeptidase/D-alanyl-D-alanine-endopeptidase [Streptomyces sodiiphilus]|uniref:D-alanyl-D-alanine carboxypeptidase/D-alanyl-D-alanine-endopeptidase n=1 Tax=Streptomyces sodiiphilus TaxID=226217 RepID=A0ABN2PSJ3_9ACTN
MLRRASETVRGHRAAVRLAVGSAAAGLAVAAVTVALTGPWDHGQRTAERVSAAEASDGRDGLPPARPAAGGPAPAGAVLTPLAPLGEAPPGDAPQGRQEALPDPAALARELKPLLADEALGKGVAAAVVDLGTGEQLFALRPDAASSPASTTKLATAVAALDALGPDHRLDTHVVWDAGNRRVILVGGGDTTLTARRLEELAARTAEALRERGEHEAGVGVGYDVTRYRGGGTRHPIGVNANIAPISPLMVNAGRLDDSTRGPAPRTGDPAGEAAAAFTGHLREHGITVQGASAAKRTAPAGAERLAGHRSAPVSVLVERMLTDSDNDLAESLALQTAIAGGHRADRAGAARAVTERLEDLGLPMRGVRIADGSGLDRSGRLTPGLLTGLLVTAADPGHPELRPALTGLPVAGFTGTLSGRYAEEGGGLVRAKTGTLTGVNALAGTVVTGDGRVLAFAFLATGTPGARAAEEALDRAAARLADH